MLRQAGNLFMRYLSIVVSLLCLSACGRSTAPDFHAQPWGAFKVEFCTEVSALEFWETRDADKLSLLQGALYIEDSTPLDHAVSSRNHRLFIVLNSETGSNTWQLTLKRDQEHVSFFNTAAPLQSYQAKTDPMFYRALNTLLTSHMGDTLDIFRKCEVGVN
jgi:hypothetical protein